MLSMALVSWVVWVLQLVKYQFSELCSAVQWVQELDSVAVSDRRHSNVKIYTWLFLCPVSGTHVRKQVVTLHSRKWWKQYNFWLHLGPKCHGLNSEAWVSVIGWPQLWLLVKWMEISLISHKYEWRSFRSQHKLLFSQHNREWFYLLFPIYMRWNMLKRWIGNWLAELLCITILI